jgi:cyclase
MENEGAGEILLNSIDRDGMMQGYDIELIKSTSQAIKIPLIASGGAGKLDDFRLAVKEGGAAGVAAGSFFVFQGKRRAVLITYPSYSEISNLFD